MSYNQVILVGNLGADPDIRTFVDGGKIAMLRLATSERWKDRNGERQERTEWHRIIIKPDGLVGVAQSYLKKGSKILVEGTLRTRKWNDNGTDRYATEVCVEMRGKLVLLETRQNNQQGDNYPDSNATSNELDDEIPF